MSPFPSLQPFSLGKKGNRGPARSKPTLGDSFDKSEGPQALAGGSFSLGEKVRMRGKELSRSHRRRWISEVANSFQA
jgi:hypothetical protein